MLVYQRVIDELWLLDDYGDTIQSMYINWASLLTKASPVVWKELRDSRRLPNQAPQWCERWFINPMDTIAGWWFGTLFIFPFHIWDVILPIDFHSIIFQRGRSTTNQIKHEASNWVSPFKVTNFDSFVWELLQILPESRHDQLTRLINTKWLSRLKGITWRIIPLSKWLTTIVIKCYNNPVENKINPQIGDLRSQGQIINHLGTHADNLCCPLWVLPVTDGFCVQLFGILIMRGCS